MAMYLLHGTLIATILGVDRLPSGHGVNRFGKNGGVRKEKSTRKLLSELKRACFCRPRIIGTRFYATIDLEKARAGRTRTLDTEAFNPQWNETFRIYCAHWISNVIFTVKAVDPVGATLIGRAYLPVTEVLKGFEIEKWVEIRDVVGNPIPGSYKIHVKLQYFSVNQDPNWSKGIKTPEFTGVPRTFFRQRKGCQITLYQDAHEPDDEIAEGLKSAGLYESNRCWEDIFEAIHEAKHFIYITGWSVYTKITLIRDPKRPIPPGGDLTLGELLKKKADEGVRVLLLVWDDRTSGVLRRDGIMGTHDQETLQYFQFTNVHCELCPRIPGYGESYIQGFKVSTMFTHHQKTILVDCDVQSGRSDTRSLVSFLGGIDLCDGRYDTHDHPLFKTLDTTHKDDFHQPCFPGSSVKKGGPREPWHDIHCRIEGPAAWDVLYNFEQRWQKQVGSKLLFSMSELYKFLVRPTPVTASEDYDTWNVQVFRSIDIGAVDGFPKTPDEAAEIGLVTGKDNVIDRSIQDAYINAIRRAKNFIYIENQYFIGSSYGWDSRGGDIKVEDINALNLIPREISLKIASKIESSERFTVYIVIPMWPEGIPESGSVQAILDWQTRTMEMMYKDIANALKAKNLNNVDLRDYLTFFCLGNREAERSGEYVPQEQPEQDTDYIRSQQSRRFMIYVHAKMMIVDDEYIILGSANINQRSMDGARDTEIAMGAYQPHHLTSNINNNNNKKQEIAGSRGRIHGFRMALWLEHLGRLYEDFENPESLTCVRHVNEMADEYWQIYSSETWENDEDLIGHLLRYPVNVGSNGDISELHGFHYFPDTKAPVLGTKSDVLIPILTT